MPQISIVIPVYNKAKYLKETIKSVLNQDFKDFELILIDDGSTDQSPDIIQSFSDPRIRYYTQKNQGVAVARNNGVKQAKTNLICFLDADDLWEPHHLETIWALYQQFPQAGFFATAYRIQYNQHQKDYVYPFSKSPVLIQKYYRYDKGQALFFISNFAVKKEVFIKENGFKPEIHAEDTDFFIRLALKYPMAYSKTISMLHINEAENSLFAHYDIEKKVQLIQSFKAEEKADQDLKAYLDIHRYAWSIEYLLSGEEKKAQKLLAEIDDKHLNYKQKLLIHTPGKLLIFLKKIQLELRKLGINITPFSKK